MALWLDQLLPASWRGIPFVVEQSSFTTGRRVAVHEYPFKDLPYVEDLGLANQVISFTGFLVGDDCYVQRDLLAGACQQRGSGTLIHPSLTLIPSAALTTATFTERAEKGRVVEVQFSFIVTGDTLLTLFNTFPLSILSTITLAVTAAKTMLAAGRGLFATTMAAGVFVAGSVIGVFNAIGDFGNQVTKVVSDTGMIFNGLNGIQSVSDPTFTLSRYTPGNLTSVNPVISTVDSTQPPATRINTATQLLLDNTVTQREVVKEAISNAESLALSDPTGAFYESIAAMTEALRTAINDPADQVRLLARLATFAAVSNPTTQAMVDAASAACRRAVLASLATACSNYNPTNAQDVTAILFYLIPFFDAEISYAAAQNDIDTYNALVALRAAVVNDLQTRGSNLPELITITEPANRPSLTIAYQLYRNAQRETELVARVDPIHPLFMPIEFQALSS